MFFTMKHIEIRKSFMAYRVPPSPTPLFPQNLLPVYVYIFCTIYESGELAQGGGEDNLWPENQ